MSNVINNQFPTEYFLQIKDEQYFIGRIIIEKVGEKFNAEIDIINKESRKIYKHVDIIYGELDPLEAREKGIEKLSFFLMNK